MLAQGGEDGIDPAEEDGREVGTGAVDGAHGAVGGGKEIEGRAGNGEAGVGFGAERNHGKPGIREGFAEAGKEFVASVVSGSPAEEAGGNEGAGRGKISF